MCNFIGETLDFAIDSLKKEGKVYEVVYLENRFKDVDYDTLIVVSQKEERSTTYLNVATFKVGLD